MLTLVASNWTFLFRNPMHVCATMLLLYMFWFILIDPAHEISFMGGYDVLAILMGAALGQYLPTVFHLTKFVPHTNLALAKQLDVWTHHVVYWPVFGLASVATTLAFVWLNWHWEWAFMIVAVLFGALVLFSYVLVVGTLRPDVTALHLAWLGMVLWQVLFYGAAQQIDPSVAPILWLSCLVVVALVCLTFVNTLMNIFWPPVNYSDPRNGIIIHDDGQTVFGNPYGGDDDNDDLVSEAASVESSVGMRPTFLRRMIGYLRGEDMNIYSPANNNMIALSERMAQYRSARAYESVSAGQMAQAPSSLPTVSAAGNGDPLIPSTYYGPHAPAGNLSTSPPPISPGPSQSEYSTSSTLTNALSPSSVAYLSRAAAMPGF